MRRQPCSAGYIRRFKITVARRRGAALFNSGQSYSFLGALRDPGDRRPSISMRSVDVRVLGCNNSADAGVVGSTMSDTPTRRGLPPELDRIAHERRARLIAQLHRRLITRCLIAHPDGADTIELAHWAIR